MFSSTLKMVAAALCCAALGVGSNSAAIAADSTMAPEGAISISVTDSNGRASPGAVVSISVLPMDKRDGDLHFERLDVSTADNSGVASLAFELPDVYRFANEDGSVDLRVTAQSADGSQGMAYSLPIWPVSSGWNTRVEGNPGLEFSAQERLSQERKDRVELRELKITMTQNPDVAAVSGDMGTTSLPFRACNPQNLNEVEVPVATSYYASSWLPVKRVETKSNSRFKYDWSSSNETKFTLVYHGTYAGLTSSTTQATSVGYSYTSTNNANRNLEVHWRYRMYDILCYNVLFGQYVSDTGKDEWRPNNWTGGTQTAAVTGTQFSCSGTNLTNMVATTWVAQTTTTSHSNGATLAGVGLTQSQKGTSTHKLTVIPDTGATAQICGSNAYPISAQKVKEI